ncbi:MAG: hypothetical protein ACRD0L_14070 [Acidimicrobiales bacterium]
MEAPPLARPGHEGRGAGGRLLWPGPGAHARSRAGRGGVGQADRLLERTVPLVLVLAGAALRIEQLAAHRSLWPDEAMLAYNIVHRSFAGLLQPLAFQQGAPVGFLWAERASVLVLGNNEYALTVLPLLAGLASLVLVWYVASRLLSPLATAAAVALFAFSPPLVFYATEAKQYSVDVLCTLVVVALGVGLVSGGTFPRRRLAVFAVVGAVLVWCSHAAVLVGGAEAGLLVVRAAASRRWAAAGRTVAAAAVIAASAAVDYLVSLRHLGHDTVLLAYWASGFVPHPLSPASALHWVARAASGLMADPAGFSIVWLAVGAFVVGAAVLVRRRGWTAVALLVVLAAAFLGAWSGKYPVESRLALFLVPVLLVGLAATLDLGGARALPARRARPARRQASERQAPRRPPGGRVAAAALRGLAGAVLVVLAVHPLAGAYQEAAHPIRISEVRPVLAYVKAHLRPGDAIDLDRGAGNVWGYYASTLGLHMPATVVEPAASGGTCADPRSIVPAGARRVWIVFGYHLSFAPADERQVYLERFAAIGRLAGHYSVDKASAYLFDLPGPGSTGRTGRTSPAAASGGEACLVPVPLAPVPPTGLRSGPFGTGRLT